jgi:type IV secretory pathway TrbD component
MTDYFSDGGKMNINMGESDRIFRLAAGLAIIIIGLVAKSWWGLIGIPFVVTAVLGHCPVYASIGINTRKFALK